MLDVLNNFIINRATAKSIVKFYRNLIISVIHHNTYSFLLRYADF